MTTGMSLLIHGSSLDHLPPDDVLPALGALLALPVVAALAEDLVVDGVVAPGRDLVADAALVSVLL